MSTEEFKIPDMLNQSQANQNPFPKREAALAAMHDFELGPDLTAAREVADEFEEATRTTLNTIEGYDYVRERARARVEEVRNYLQAVESAVNEFEASIDDPQEVQGIDSATQALVTVLGDARTTAINARDNLEVLGKTRINQRIEHGNLTGQYGTTARDVQGEETWEMIQQRLHQRSGIMQQLGRHANGSNGSVSLPISQAQHRRDIHRETVDKLVILEDGIVETKDKYDASVTDVHGLSSKKEEVLTHYNSMQEHMDGHASRLEREFVGNVLGIIIKPQIQPTIYEGMQNAEAVTQPELTEDKPGITLPASISGRTAVTFSTVKGLHAGTQSPSEVSIRAIE